MNLTLKNWTLAVNVEGAPVLQYDNNTVAVTVTGDIPTGWTWELLLAHGEYLDVAHMDADEGGLTVVLTAEQLAFDGYYTAQLRATQGDKVKHSSPVLFAVGDTLSGDEQWPEIPTAFTQALARAEAAIETAQEIESTVIEAAEDAQTAAASAAGSASDASGSASAAQAAQSAAESAQSAAEEAADDVSEMVDRMGNVPVVSGTGYTATNTGVTETLTKTNIKTGEETTETVPMPVANAQTAGLMTPEQVEAIEELESRVGGLENQNARLSYTASGTPTAAEVRAFVIAAGYTDTTKWASIGVVVSATNHIWRYYANTQTWTDIGLDTVQQASSSVKGIVQGSSTAGKVFVEADGTMSLNGYDALTSGLSNVQSGLATKQNTLTFDTAPTAGSSNPVTSGGVWNAGNPVLLYTNNTNLNMNTKILEYETVIQYRWLYIVSGNTYAGNRCVVYVPDIEDGGGFNTVSWEQQLNYISVSAFTFSEEQGLMFNTNRILGGGSYNQIVNMTNGWGNPRKIYGIK